MGTEEQDRIERAWDRCERKVCDLFNDFTARTGLYVKAVEVRRTPKRGHRFTAVTLDYVHKPVAERLMDSPPEGHPWSDVERHAGQVQGNDKVAPVNDHHIP